MNPEIAPVDVALPALRELLREAGVEYKIVGGLAVIHHGYERFTSGIDVLLTRAGAEAIVDHLGAHGFSSQSGRRLRHEPTGVRVDVLREGDTLVGPRPAPPLPGPGALPGAATDPQVVALPALLDLKLDAGRRQDLTDVVKLLARLDDSRFVHVEAAVRPHHRAELASLRAEALEELRWEAANE